MQKKTNNKESKKKKPLKACSVHGVVLETFTQTLSLFLLFLRGWPQGRPGSPRGVCMSAPSRHAGRLYHRSAKSDVGSIPSSTEMQPLLGKKKP